MPMRLQEIHPAVVHLPITLLPLSLAADAAAWVTRSRRLADVGRATFLGTLVTGGIAGATGLIAQEEVAATDEAHDLLVTHRTINAGVLAGLALLGSRRLLRRMPTMRHLVLGSGLLAGVVYSAYLGGRMVYEYGVGVKPAGGLAPDRSPEYGPEDVGLAAQRVRRDLREGVRHAMDDMREGQLVPTLVSADGGNGVAPAS